MLPNALATAARTVGAAAATVLVVDDDRDVRTLLGLLLREEGYDLVGLAADGVEGVALALEHEPDVIVLDVHMPNLGGLDAARKLRPQLPRTRIVLLSAHDDPALVEEAAAIPVDAFVAKASPLTELLGVVAGFEHR